MRFAEEIVAATFVPAWRSLLARRLHARGLSQTEIATLLGITQSAVSKHLLGKLGTDDRLAAEPRMQAVAARVADGLAERRLSPFEALLEAEALVREFETRGPICRIHEDEMPSLQGLGCDICVRVTGTALGPEQAALQDLRAALRILEATPGLARLLPHVGTNVARAVPSARDITGIAAVPGRLYELRGGVKVPAPPEFGVSRHMAEILLAITRVEPGRLACLNLTPHPALLDAARAAGLRVVEVSADVERAPESLSVSAPVPDVLHHAGAFGVEPQAYFSGPDAQQLALRLRALVEHLQT